MSHLYCLLSNLYCLTYIAAWLVKVVQYVLLPLPRSLVVAATAVILESDEGRVSCSLAAVDDTAPTFADLMNRNIMLLTLLPPCPCASFVVVYCCLLLLSINDYCCCLSMSIVVIHQCLLLSSINVYWHIYIPSLHGPSGQWQMFLCGKSCSYIDILSSASQSCQWYFD